MVVRVAEGSRAVGGGPRSGAEPPGKPSANPEAAREGGSGPGARRPGGPRRESHSGHLTGQCRWESGFPMFLQRMQPRGVIEVCLGQCRRRRDGNLASRIRGRPFARMGRCRKRDNKRIRLGLLTSRLISIGASGCGGCGGDASLARGQFPKQEDEGGCIQVPRRRSLKESRRRCGGHCLAPSPALFLRPVPVFQVVQAQIQPCKVANRVPPQPPQPAMARLTLDSAEMPS